MAKINFPDSPTVDQEFVLDDNKTYIWDGNKWDLIVQGASPGTLPPTITIVTEAPDGVTFTLRNNDDSTAIISYQVGNGNGAITLDSNVTSSNITVALTAGTYTLSAFATVVGEVATSATASVTITIPTYTLLYEQDVTTATTQIDITGLSITKDDGLRLVYTVVGGGDIGVYPNDLTTDTNYYSQYLYGGGSTIGAGRFNRNVTIQAGSIKTSGFADIKISNNNRFVAQTQFVYNIGSGSSAMLHLNFNIVGTETVNTITKLSLKPENAPNQIGVGSKIALYKVTEAA